MTTINTTTSARGPIVPTPQAVAVQRPVRSAALTGGLWRHWQQVNRSASIPLGIGKLDEAGNFTNLRLAAGEALDADHQGPVYMDSDVYKMLETVAYELVDGGDDAELEEFVTTASGLIASAQAEDGYLNSTYQVRGPQARYQDLNNSHELYTAGHLFQAVAALARTGDDRLVPVARRLADHLVQVFLTERLPKLDGHPGVETALVELYRCLGVPEYLELAQRLLDDRGQGMVGRHAVGPLYQQDAFGVREAPVLTGHAVRAMYLEAGIVDVYLETGDRSLLDASVARWEDMVATRTALTGGHGSRQLKEAFGEGYELPPDQSYNETCAAVASVHWSWRLLLATGEARYADLIERTLYNVFAASVSLDGLEFFKGNPLQRRSDHAMAIGDPRWRDGWFWSACCPPNVTRLMASLQHYLGSSDPDGITVHQYADAVLGAGLRAGDVDLAVATTLPWDGGTSVRVEATPDAEWTLSLRVPSWTADPEIRLNGAPVETTNHSGYLRIRRVWRPGDEIRLGFDMPPRLTSPHPRIDALRGCLALERGPLVYCFEQVDQDSDVDVERLQLVPDLQAITADSHTDLPGVGRTTTLSVPARQLVDAPTEGLPYYSGARSWSTRPVRAVAVPYFQWANRDRQAMRIWMPVDA
ncbi:glycoside hydrolase family 127 protein [Occultella glacieicola]|uniref:Glycoside hydrolase family 127 protein n=1 Tax=Occultella glacieicola TaxID=2518684 RepID=A0ABY2DY41_9MICO|nr:beta-L-arabinofuranosidase domain-containing protein [Occultella glacieicola]TDE88525.1 glycoside hydrolase family 127 protein [Occultella glacieicola]